MGYADARREASIACQKPASARPRGFDSSRNHARRCGPADNARKLQRANQRPAQRPKNCRADDAGVCARERVIGTRNSLTCDGSAWTKNLSDELFCLAAAIWQ